MTKKLTKILILSFSIALALSLIACTATEVPRAAPPTIDAVTDTRDHVVGDSIDLRTTTARDAGGRALTPDVEVFFGLTQIIPINNRFTATTAGRYMVRFSVTDANGLSATRSYYVTVRAPTDTHNLRTLIAQADALDSGVYFDAYFDDFVTARTAARTALADARIAPDAVQYAYDTLKSAHEKLVPIPVIQPLENRLTFLPGDVVRVPFPDAYCLDGVTVATVARDWVRDQAGDTVTVTDATFTAAAGNWWYSARFSADFTYAGQTVTALYTYKIYLGGSNGSEGHPFFIYNAAELMSMKGDNYYVLAGDLDLTGVFYRQPQGFYGTLDGAGYAITNLSMKGDIVGLFGTVTGTLNIVRLILCGFELEGSVAAGALIAEVEFTEPRTAHVQIVGVEVKGLNLTVRSATGDVYAGGLIGRIFIDIPEDFRNLVTIAGSGVSGVINAESHDNLGMAFAGGVVGYYYAQAPFNELISMSILETTAMSIDADISAGAGFLAYAGGLIGLYHAHNNQYAFYPQQRPPHSLRFLAVTNVEIAGSVTATSARTAFAGGLFGYVNLYFSTTSTIVEAVADISVIATARNAIANSLLELRRFDNSSVFNISFSENSGLVTRNSII